MTERAPTVVRLRLSIMMFLQYAIWGVWLPVIAIYLGASTEAGGLGFTGARIGAILGIAGACGAILAPFIAGQVADRYLNAERALGLLLILGGVVHYGLYYAHTYISFLGMSVIYSILYMPTIALTNSICFANLPDAEKSFPRVRVWGTIGWIVAASVFPLMWLQENASFTWLPWFFNGDEKANATTLIADSLRVSGVLSVLYGLYAIIFLPRTPPKRDVTSVAWARAFQMLLSPGVLVLTIAAVIISMIHNVYFLRTGPWLEAIGFDASKIGAVTSVGQVVEIGTLAVLGLFIAKLGYRKVLTIGCLAYFLRFAVFAIATEESAALAYVGIALHGFCFAFFFAAAFLFIDAVAETDIRHSAQTAFGIMILGVGPILSGFFNGWLDKVGAGAGTEFTGVFAPITRAWRGLIEGVGVNLTANAFSWPAVWWTQAFFGLMAFLLVLIAFRDRRAEVSQE